MSQTILRISDHTSTEDVASWPAILDRDLSFSLSKASSFEPGAEGSGLAYLAIAIRDSASIKVTCDFAQPKTASEFAESLLCSVFGFALIRAATSIRFSGEEGDNSRGFRTLTGELYDAAKGVLGAGDKVDLIAFDPRRRVPRALLAKSQAVDKDGLPLPSAFQTDLQRVLSGMGLPEIGTQSTLPVLIGFVYELFLNTIQHGLPRDSRLAAVSTRGISLTRLAFSLSQLPTRRLSRDLKEYLARAAELQARQTNLFVVCISVMDMGDGIQNTLPSDSESENPGARLLRAFQVGQSRKARSSVERGVGLHKVVEAAFRLGARLEVTSAGRRLVKDFSLGEDRFPSLANAQETLLPEHLSAGTSVAMYIPNLLSDIDQQKLPL